MPPETVGAAIREAADRLAATSETPRLDAELLMAHALGVTREAMLLAGLERPFPPFVPSEGSPEPSRRIEEQVVGVEASVAHGASTALGTNGGGEAALGVANLSPVRPEPVEGRAPNAAPAARPSTALRTNGEGKKGREKRPSTRDRSSPPFVPSEVEGPAASVAHGASILPLGSGEPSLRTNGGSGADQAESPARAFPALLARRLAGEPLAYITGTRAFWTIELGVAPGVLIPRPDSETLIEAAVAHFAGTAGPRRILDLGTGSGALLLAALAEWPQATGVGIDRSEAALAIARGNAEQLGMADRAEIVAGRWGGTGEAFDLILCNPPYIGTAEPLPRDVAEHEPHAALFAGTDGLDDYRALAPLLPQQIAPGGVACIEIGATQAAAVSALLDARGLVVQIRHDLGGRDRCVVAMH